MPLRIERLGFGGALREGRKLRQRRRKRPIGRRGRRVLDQQGGASVGYPGEIEVPGKGQQVADRGGIQGWRRFAQRSIPVGVGALPQGAGKGPQQELRGVAQRIVPVGALAVGISRGISGWLSGTSLLLRSFFRSVTTRHVYGDAGRGDVRHKRRKRHAIGPQPSGETTERVACTARYVGSVEHKAYPSSAGPPALRTDATPCDPKLSFDNIRTALVEGIRRGCVSTAMEQGFPKYVWGWLDGDLYEARHINGPGRNVRRLQAHPRDPMGRLDWGGAA